MSYFIIEHPTRGIVQTKLTDSGRPSYSWSKNRSDEDNARYFELRSAILDLADLAPGCRVLRQPGPRQTEWEVVWPIKTEWEVVWPIKT